MTARLVRTVIALLPSVPSSSQLAAWGGLLYLHTACVLASQVTLAWDANTEPILGGYRVYYGEASRSYNGSVDVGNQVSYTLTGLKENITYYFAVTAYDNNRMIESRWSDEINWNTAAPPTYLSGTHPETGCAVLSLVDGQGNLGGCSALGCYPGWLVTSYYRNADRLGAILGTHPASGCSGLVTVDTMGALGGYMDLGCYPGWWATSYGR